MISMAENIKERKNNLPKANIKVLYVIAEQVQNNVGDYGQNNIHFTMELNYNTALKFTILEDSNSYNDTNVISTFLVLDKSEVIRNILTRNMFMAQDRD